MCLLGQTDDDETVIAAIKSFDVEGKIDSEKYDLY